MEPHLLLVTPADSYRTRDYLDAARTLGCRVTVATDAAVAMDWSAISVPLADPARAAELILGQLSVEPYAVLGTDGPAVAVAASIARTLGHETNSAHALAAADDKLQQRRALATVGLSQPRFTSSEAGRGWTHFPAVVKPVDRSASQGVLRADDATDLEARIAVVRDIVGPNPPVLIEELVPGIEVAVEGILRRGSLEVLAVFDKPDAPTGPTFPETLLIRPARLDRSTVETVVDLAANACAAIGLTEGPVHVECKIDGERVWFIELAARTIGGLCSRSLRPGGNSLEELVLLHALGRPTRSEESHGASGVLMLPVPKRGVLDHVGGQDQALVVPAVTDVIISIGPGEEVVPLPHGNRYLGFVFARADTADDVEEALRQAWSVLDVRISASTSDSTDRRQLRGRSDQPPG
jgi:biotin carboxylase